MMSYRMALGFLLLGFTQSVLAYRGDGFNPGDWRAMPVTAELGREHASASLQVDIYNPDAFPKLCTIIVEQDGRSVTAFQKLELEAKSHKIARLTLAPSLRLELAQLKFNAACIAPDADEAAASLPDPASLSCLPAERDCDQLCKADANEPRRCSNQHLVLSYSSPATITTSGDSLHLSRKVTSHATSTLYCQWLATARSSIPGSSSVATLTRALPLTVVEPQTTVVAEFVFFNGEGGRGHVTDLSESQFAAACSVNQPQVERPIWQECNPLKRPECNWAEPER